MQLEKYLDGQHDPKPEDKDSAPRRDRGRFDTIEEAMESLRQGRLIILVDDEDRENEGDLVCAAEKITPNIINFMALHGRGLICLALEPAACDRLQLPPMVENNRTPLGTNFTVSIEAAHGVTTGISAHDRAHTILTAVRPDSGPDDIRSPGHVFPLRAKRGGVLVRAGQTEGSVDLARLAGLAPAGVICEIMDEDGSMARYPRLRQFADQHDIKLVTVADLIAFRRKREQLLVRRVAEAKLPTVHGKDFRIVGYQSQETEESFIAIVLGEWQPDDPVLVRVHSQCLTGDVFGSLRCDCGPQLDAALDRVAQEGRGVVVYLPQEGRGIGLINKIRAYSLQDGGADTVEANRTLGFAEDLRDYGIGVAILRDLGVKKMRLLTNNPRKIVGLSGHGLEVVERVPIQADPSAHNRGYLLTKKLKLGHLLTLEH
jgi:3,4-dihydroxy 2-butanone 4-phosphate synthase/GTP cyclohydrolase II